MPAFFRIITGSIHKHLYIVFTTTNMFLYQPVKIALVVGEVLTHMKAMEVHVTSLTQLVDTERLQLLVTTRMLI